MELKSFVCYVCAIEDFNIHVCAIDNLNTLRTQLAVYLYIALVFNKSLEVAYFCMFHL